MHRHGMDEPLQHSLIERADRAKATSNPQEALLESEEARRTLVYAYLASDAPLLMWKCHE